MVSSPIIISGQYRGRRLKVLQNMALRPTLSRIKKTLFDIIASRFPPNQRTDKIFLDIFAGTGAIGLEALSIGFQTAYFIENHPESLQLLQENAQIAENAHILKADAFFPPPALAVADIAFFDPPYDIPIGDWQKLLLAYEKTGWISKDSWIIAQHVSTPVPNFVPFHSTDSRAFGKTTLTFLSHG